MSWWYEVSAVGPGTVRQAAASPGPGWHGPYGSQQLAQQALSSAQGTGGGGAGGQWYVITIRRTPRTPFTVEVSQKPFPAGAGVTALQDSGPYATQAEAQAAADKLQHEIVPGVPGLGSTPDWQTLLVRIGEVLLGIVLIGIGLARITGTQNAVAAIAKARIP